MPLSCNELIIGNDGAIKKRVVVLLVLLCSAVVLLSMSLIVRQWLTFNLKVETILSPDQLKLLASRWETYETIEYLRLHHKPENRYFVFRQSDMAYYSGLPIISHMDARQITSFTEKDPVKAFHDLKAQGVTHVIAPTYPVAEIYNSSIGKILSSVAYVSLVFQTKNERVYLLNDDVLDDTTLESLPTSGVETIKLNRGLLESLNFLKFLSKKRTYQSYGRGSDKIYALYPKIETVFRQGTYVLKAKVQGKGYYRVWFQGGERATQLIGTGILLDEEENISQIFWVAPTHGERNDFQNRIIFEQVRGERFEVSSAQILRVKEDRIKRYDISPWSPSLHKIGNNRFHDSIQWITEKAASGLHMQGIDFRPVSVVREIPSLKAGDRIDFSVEVSGYGAMSLAVRGVCEETEQLEEYDLDRYESKSYNLRDRRTTYRGMIPVGCDLILPTLEVQLSSPAADYKTKGDDVRAYATVYSLNYAGQEMLKKEILKK